jgi:hypothetical protein
MAQHVHTHTHTEAVPTSCGSRISVVRLVVNAAANGMNCGAPLALPYFAAAADLAKTRETVTEEWLAARWNDGQLLDRLFFTTALAADVTGTNRICRTGRIGRCHSGRP